MFCAMSRCFPFPPPGYEKARIDDTDLLEKEKQKEKKHKKEKKDKEKREGKDKKEKDKNKEKHKDKKDRKEKLNENDKDRDKEKNRSSGAKKSEPRTGSHDGEKLESNSFKTSYPKDSKHVEELAKRIRDEGGSSASQVVERVAAPDDRMVELARQIRDSDGASRSEMVEKIASESKVKLPDTETIFSRKHEKEKVKDKKEGHQKANGQNNYVGARGAEKSSGRIPSQVEQESGEPFTKPLPKENVEKHVEGKEKGEPITKPLPKENVDKHAVGKEKSKHKEREGKDDKHKHKDRDKGKDKKSKDKDRNKEKKAEEKAKENKESSKEHTKSKGSEPKLKENAKESLDFRNTKLRDPPKVSKPVLPSDGTLGKRKEPERNGYMLDEEYRSNKSANPLSLRQPVTETDRKPELIQTAAEFVLQGAANNHVVAGKDIKINGFIPPQQHNESSAKPATTQTPAKPAATHATRNENGEASVKVKPPHPDTKHLSQILCVPMVEDFPDSLDQEWLLGGEHRPSKKLKVGSPAVDGTLQVWSQAVRIESADISALPYVVPY